MDPHGSFAPRGGPREPHRIYLWIAVPFIVGVIAVAALPPTLLPRCPFYVIAGFPCPTCGLLRAVRLMAAGQLSAAFRLQPLMSAVCVAGLLSAGYALFAVAFRLPWINLSAMSQRTRLWVAVVAVLLALAN